jgi:hypothetical protein
VIHPVAKFVPHHPVLEYLRIGWCPTLAHADMHHGEFSVLLIWMCGCEPVERTPVGACRDGVVQ